MTVFSFEKYDRPLLRMPIRLGCHDRNLFHAIFWSKSEDVSTGTFSIRTSFVNMNLPRLWQWNHHVDLSGSIQSLTHKYAILNEHFLSLKLRIGLHQGYKACISHCISYAKQLNVCTEQLHQNLSVCDLEQLGLSSLAVGRVVSG